ncbi:MAG: DUF3341 domain-containing protein [Planctomycetes bacterium]|nr:DUF3341 domain-containing protein [Planctomycetota bacterium]MBL7008630.1 DUF3341 domain-containing protein [Planctomycetota bacterium]
MTADARLYGVLAEFDNVDDLVDAAKQVREAGYTRFDAHTPFPVHGLDDAMGVRPTILPWIVLAAGLVGLSSGFLMQWWMNDVDYSYAISGKPMFGLPGAVPVAYELTILLASFGAFVGMLALNNLPKWFHPLFRVERFSRATSDRFYLVIEGRDPNFGPRTSDWLGGLGCTALEAVPMPDEPEGLPRPLKGLAWVMTSLALLPVAMIANARFSESSTPQIHLVGNMDFQEKYKAQQTSQLFADGRAMRPDSAGTVARGELDISSPQVTGRNADGSYVAGFPVAVDAGLMARGRERFDIYCATCHGLNGKGDSVVSRRALALQEQGKAAWTPPTDLTSQVVLDQPPGQIFETITLGKNNMPSYAQQLRPRDRWAIALYMEALQSAQAAPSEDE